MKNVSNCLTSIVEMNPAGKNKKPYRMSNRQGGFEILQESTGRVGISFPFFPNIFEI